MSQAPRATLTIRLDTDVNEPIPDGELSAIEASVHKSVERIARALHDRQGQGRSPAFLKELASLDAVDVSARTSVMVFEAPHDMEHFPIDFGEEDAGVQAIELFVEGVGALVDGKAFESTIGAPAERSVVAFVHAVETHERVSITASVGETDTALEFDPRAVPFATATRGRTQSPTTLSFVGRLYGVNLATHTFRFKDEFGRTRFLTIGDGLDEVALGRESLGEIVFVKAEARPVEEGGAAHFVASSIEAVDQDVASGYDHWDVGGDIKSDELHHLAEALTIPGLDIEVPTNHDSSGE